MKLIASDRMRRAGRLAGVLGTGLLLLPLLGSSPAPGTHAAFNDVAPVSTGAFGSATVAPVTELTCTNSNLNRVTYSWTPQRDRSYQLQVFQGDVLRISVITSLSSVELNVGNLNLLQSGRHRVRVTVDPGDYTVTGTFELGEAALDEITEANDGDVVAATIVVEVPIGTEVDNASQDTVIDLEAFTVTATQVNA